jgi:hypothetical protein
VDVTLAPQMTRLMFENLARGDGTEQVGKGSR